MKDGRGIEIHVGDEILFNGVPYKVQNVRELSRLANGEQKPGLDLLLELNIDPRQYEPAANQPGILVLPAKPEETPQANGRGGLASFRRQ